MIQKLKTKKKYIFLFLFYFTLYAHSFSVVAGQAGDLDAAFGTNGIVISKQLWFNQPSFSATGLVARGAPLNDIVATATRLEDGKLGKSAVLVSYKQANGSLNAGAFGTGNPPQGFTSFINFDQFIAIATFAEANLQRLIVVGGQGFLNTTPLLKKTTATGIDINSNTIENQEGVFNALVVDQANQYVFAAGLRAAFGVGTFRAFRFSRFNLSDFSDVKDTITPFFGHSQINSITMQSDGRIVAAGESTKNTLTQFIISRYLSDATVDSSFSNIYPFPEESGANAVAIQIVDGTEKIVAAGWIKRSANQQSLALVRYNLDGELDTSFGSQQSGIVIDSFGGKQVIAHALAIDKNNKIIVVGEYIETAESSPIFIVACYNSNGTLDRTFGPDANGWITTSITQNGSVINAVAIDEENRIIAGGYSINNNGLYEITLARYIGSQASQPGSPGSIDFDFGDRGLVTTSFSTLSPSTPSPVFLSTADNSSRSNSFAHSFSANSSLANINSSFPIPATLSHKPRSYKERYAKQRAATRSFNSLSPQARKTVPKISRLNKAVFRNFVTGNNSVITGMAIRGAPYNDIIVVGNTETAPISQIIASYSSSDGTLNTGNFGSPLSQGYLNYLTAIANRGNAVTIFNNTNNIVTAGSVGSGTNKTLTFFSFATNGGGLAGPGEKRLNSWFGEFNALVPSSASSSLYAGFVYQNNASSKQFVIGKFNNFSGAAEQDFNGGLPLITNFTNTPKDMSQINALAVYPTSGKIVAAGTALIDGQNRFVLARYLNNGPLDQSFNETGKVITDFSTITLIPHRDDVAYGIALQQIDGETKIVVVGATARKHGGSFIVLARYNDDGTLDPTFGYTGTGIRISCFGSSSDSAQAVVIDENNRIVIAGIASTKPTPNANPINKFIIARYHPDGTVDKSFGGSGRVFARFFGKGAGANAIALQTINGKPRIIASGFAIDNAGYSRFALARYFA